MNEERLKPEIPPITDAEIDALIKHVPRLAKDRDVELPEKWSRHPADATLFDNTLIYDKKFYVYPREDMFIQVKYVAESKYLDIAKNNIMNAADPMLFLDVIKALKELAASDVVK